MFSSWYYIAFTLIQKLALETFLEIRSVALSHTWRVFKLEQDCCRPKQGNSIQSLIYCIWIWSWVFFFCLVKWSSENVWSQNVPIQSSSIQFGKHRKFCHPRLQHLIQIFTAFAFVQQIGHFYISQTLQVRQNSKSVCSFKVWVQLAASMKYTGLGSFPPTEMTEITIFIWNKIVMVFFIFYFMISFLICLG